MKPKILITGATGSTGTIATKLLLERGFPVRALVRKIDERSEQLKALGAEIAVGDILDFRSIQPAFQGIQRAYMCYPVAPGLVQATVSFEQAALDAKVEYVVNISQRTCREDAIANSAVQHWLAERDLDRSGLAVTHLRPTMFNEWLLYIRSKIREGEYTVPFGPTGKIAPISARDQAEVIAALLADPADHAGKTYPLLGPVELTPAEIAAEATKGLGRQVTYKQVTPEDWLDVVFGSRDIAWAADHLRGIVLQHARGDMGGTNDIVEKITGHKPEGVAEFASRNRAAFQ